MPIHIENVESTDDSIRMVLEGFKASMSAEAERFDANEDRRGDMIRRQQESETSKEKVRRKRHFIVSTMELQTNSRIFQMTIGGESGQPKAPDPDAQLSKRQWEKAMAHWRSELSRWVQMQNASTKRAWEAHTEANST